MGRRNVAFGRLQLRLEGLCARGSVCGAVFRADAAAGSVAGMDVFSPKSLKIRQPGLSVGESADHRRTDEGIPRDAAFMPREKKTRGAA